MFWHGSGQESWALSIGVSPELLQLMGSLQHVRQRWKRSLSPVSRGRDSPAPGAGCCFPRCSVQYPSLLCLLLSPGGVPWRSLFPFSAGCQLHPSPKKALGQIVHRAPAVCVGSQPGGVAGVGSTVTNAGRVGCKAEGMPASPGHSSGQR